VYPFAHLTRDEFSKLDVYDQKNQFHKDFIKLIVSNPVFRESYVKLDGLEGLIDEFEGV
jgi:hypothetical protein